MEKKSAPTLSDYDFIRYFSRFNPYYRGTIADVCFKEFRSSAEGNRICYALEIFSTFYATAEDTLRIVWTLNKKKQLKDKSFLSIFLNPPPQKAYKEILGKIKETKRLDLWLEYIGFPQNGKELKHISGFTNVLSIFDTEKTANEAYHDEMKYVLDRVISILQHGEFKIIQTAYNKVKHGLTFLEGKGVGDFKEYEYPFLILSTGISKGSGLTQFIDPKKEEQVQLSMDISKIVLTTKEANIATRLMLLWHLLLTFEEIDKDEWLTNHSNTIEWRLKVEKTKPLALEALKLPNGKSPEIILIGGEKKQIQMNDDNSRQS